VSIDVVVGDEDSPQPADGGGSTPAEETEAVAQEASAGENEDEEKEGQDYEYEGSNHREKYVTSKLLLVAVVVDQLVPIGDAEEGHGGGIRHGTAKIVVEGSHQELGASIIEINVSSRLRQSRMGAQQHQQSHT